MTPIAIAATRRVCAEGLAAALFRASIRDTREWFGSAVSAPSPRADCRSEPSTASPIRVRPRSLGSRVETEYANPRRDSVAQPPAARAARPPGDSLRGSRRRPVGRSRCRRPLSRGRLRPPEQRVADLKSLRDGSRRRREGRPGVRRGRPSDCSGSDANDRAGPGAEHGARCDVERSVVADRDTAGRQRRRGSTRVSLPLPGLRHEDVATTPGGDAARVVEALDERSGRIGLRQLTCFATPNTSSRSCRVNCAFG